MEKERSGLTGAELVDGIRENSVCAPRVSHSTKARAVGSLSCSLLEHTSPTLQWNRLQRRQWQKVSSGPPPPDFQKCFEELAQYIRKQRGKPQYLACFRFEAGQRFRFLLFVVFSLFLFLIRKKKYGKKMKNLGGPKSQTVFRF